MQKLLFKRSISKAFIMFAYLLIFLLICELRICECGDTQQQRDSAESYLEEHPTSVGVPQKVNISYIDFELDSPARTSAFQAELRDAFLKQPLTWPTDLLGKLDLCPSDIDFPSKALPDLSLIHI